MNNRFLLSVATAAVVACGSVANAQNSGPAGQSPSTGAAPQTAPSAGSSGPSGGAMSRPDPSQSGAPSNAGMKPGGAMQREDGAGQRAQDNAPGQAPRTASDSKAPADAKTNAADSKGATDSKSTTTTGQAAAGGKLSSDQRTKISTVIKQQNIRPATNINFSISVGTRVPREVGFHPLPAEIISVYPDWRGYEFFLASDGRIVVISPRTLEIVAVLDV